MSLRVSNLKLGISTILPKYTNIYYRKYTPQRSFRVLYFGSESIALKCFTKINILRKTQNVISRLDLVTANNSKKPLAIEKYAEEENIQILSWPLKNLQHSEYDVGLIASFGHLITKDVLEKFPLGMINVHPSLLPRWRGAAPIIYTLLHGDEDTGVSLMRIKADKFDVGEIISQTRVPVAKDIRLPELTEELSQLSADMLAECVSNLPNSLTNAQPQSEEGVTYARKINKSISEVQWESMTSLQVYNLYRAIYGIYTLTSKFRDKTIKLFDAFIDNSSIEEYNKEIGCLEYCEEKSALKVLCKDRKYIYFRSIRIVGKRQIRAIDFYNGYIRNMPSEKRLYVLG